MIKYEKKLSEMGPLITLGLGVLDALLRSLLEIIVRSHPMEGSYFLLVFFFQSFIVSFMLTLDDYLPAQWARAHLTSD